MEKFLTSLFTGTAGYVFWDSYDKEKGKYTKDKFKKTAKGPLGTTIATAATAVTGYCMNAYTMNQIHLKYAQSYVESMSDEELENALMQVDLLASEKEQSNMTKTI